MEASQKIGRNASELEQFAKTRLGFVAGIFGERRQNREFEEIFESTLSANKKKGIEVETALVRFSIHNSPNDMRLVLEALEECDKAMGLQ